MTDRTSSSTSPDFGVRARDALHNRVAQVTAIRAATVVLGLALVLASVGCGAPQAERQSESRPSPDATRGEDPAGGESRRVAVPLDSMPPDLRFCSAFEMPREVGRADQGALFGADEGMVLYGETGRDDPYLGPMLGVVWGSEGDHAGDGTRTPVRVRGTEGEAAPITVFQQVVLEELGTVIAWREQGLSVGLYGRYWDASRTDELVELAEALEFSGGTFHLPADALTQGYGEVFAGEPGTLSLIVFLSEYLVRYQRVAEQQHVLTITGHVQARDEFEAVRFFGHGLGIEAFEGRRALVGDAWREDAGPAVVTWREDDGFVVRVVGLGADLATAREAARATRELSEEEWDELVAASGECPSVVPPDRDG